MAEDLVFQAIVETAQSAQTLGEIKQSIKDINAALEKVPAGSKAFDDLTIALGKTKGQMLDLRERVKALDPEKTFGAVARLGSTIASGFAAAQGAIALFGGSSEDLLVVLTRVQAAMALAQGLQGLAGFTKALTTARLALTAFVAANPILTIITAVAALGAVLVTLAENWRVSNSESEKFRIEAEKQKKVNDIRKQQLDDEIELLEAAGASQEEINTLRREKLLIDIADAKNTARTIELRFGEALATNTLWETLLKYTGQSMIAATLQAKRILEAKNELVDAQKKIKEAEHDLKVLDTKIAKLTSDSKEKESERREKEKEEEVKKQLDELQADTEFWQKKNENYFEAQVKKNLGVADFGVERVKIEEVTEEEIDKIKRAYLEKELKTTAWTEQAKINYVKSGFETIGQLALAFAGKSEASQRRAFAINKAASIAGALIDTYQAAQGAFKSQTTLPLPDAPIRAFIAAGIAMAAGLARVAMIAKTQFTPAGGGGGEGGGGGGTVNMPNIQAPQQQQFIATGTEVQQTAEGEFTGFAGGGRKPQLLKAYVVETELTDTQQTIKSIQERTTF